MPNFHPTKKREMDQGDKVECVWQGRLSVEGDTVLTVRKACTATSW